MKDVLNLDKRYGWTRDMALGLGNGCSNGTHQVKKNIVLCSQTKWF